MEVELRLQHGEECEDLDVEKLVCQVEEAEVVAETVETFRDGDHLICRVVEKDVVRLVVKVEREEQLEVSAVPCPPRKVC